MAASNDVTRDTITAGDQTAPKLALLANGNVVAIWQGPDASDPNHTDVYARVFSDVTKTQSTADSYRPVISADGRYVIFGSDASLTASDTNSGLNTADTYVYDRLTQTIQLVSHDQLGQLGAGYESIGAGLSGDGVIDVFGGIGLAFHDGPQPEFVTGGKIKLASGRIRRSRAR